MLNISIYKKCNSWWKFTITLIFKNLSSTLFNMSLVYHRGTLSNLLISIDQKQQGINIVLE